MGGLGVFISSVWLLHRLVKYFLPNWFRQMPAVLGIGLAVLAVYFASLGLRPRYERSLNLNGREIKFEEFWEANSRVTYEAAQSIFLNMDVHADDDKNAVNGSSAAPAGTTAQDTATQESNSAIELWALILARFLAVLLVLFLAYQTVLRFCVDGFSRLRLTLYAFKGGPKRHLVFGLGYVGMQITKELLKKNCRVIVVERNPENKNIDIARELGAVVVVSDAKDTELLDDIPFNAVSDIYVVAGSDETNVRIATIVKEKADPNFSDIVTNRGTSTHWPGWQSIAEFVTSWFLLDVDSICYVRLYDPDLHQVLSRVFRNSISQENEHLQLRVFNSDQTAAVQLVQTQLCISGIRPSKTDETALYIIAGFDKMGQEMAIALAQFAHFENLKRSRILVLTEPDGNPSQSRVSRFLSRHPRFTASDIKEKKLEDVHFRSELDDWKHQSVPVSDASSDSGSPESPVVLEFATQTQFSSLPPRPSDPEFLKKLHELIKPEGDQQKIKPALIVCFEDESAAFTWAGVLKQSWCEYVYRNRLSTAGGDAVVLPVYVWLYDQEYLQNILEQQVGLDPAMPLRSFGHARDASSVDTIQGELTQNLAKVVDVSYQDSFATNVEVCNEKVNPEAAAKKTTPTPAPERDRSAFDPYPDFLERAKIFGDDQSNVLAGQHSIIKFVVAGGDKDKLLNGKFEFPDTDEKKEKLRKRDKFWFGSAEEKKICFIKPTLATAKAEKAQPFEKNSLSEIQKQLAEVEHNRWSAEMLMRNYEFVTFEEKQDFRTSKGKKNWRIPAHFFSRQTLIAWDGLPEEEKRKDHLQTYYVMYYLNEAAQDKQKTGIVGRFINGFRGF